MINQTYKYIEVILVDDNSDKKYAEEVKKVCETYSQVNYLSNQGNKGACAARNNGILNAKGEFVAFLDDDDFWEKDKIEKQLMLFTSEDIGLVYCGMTCFYEKENIIKKKPAIKRDKTWKELLINNYIGSTSCGIVRRTIAIEVGIFDTNMKSGQDVDFWIRIAQKYRIECVEECLLRYTYYKANTITANLNNRLESNLYLKNKYYSIIGNDDELLTVYNLKITKSYIINQKYLCAIKYILKSVLAGEYH